MSAVSELGKYQPYPEYKDSGVEWIGNIPQNWSIKKVKHLFSIHKRIAGKLGFDILSVTQKGIIIKDIESGEGQLSMDYSKYQRVTPGDYAMNHMDLLTGYVDLSKFDGVTSPDYRVFSLDKEAFSRRYYLYLFQMGYHLRIFFHMGQGASHLGRWRLATDEFNELIFPTPLPEEQSKIADFLDYETARIDKLIAKQQQLIDLLKEKRQVVISHAVTKGLNPNAPMKDSGVEWLGEVPEHWVVRRLKHHIVSMDQGWSPQCEARLSEDGEFGVMKVGCVNGGIFKAHEHKALPAELEPKTEYRLKKGQLLVSRANSRELVGSAAVVDADYENLLLCDKLYRIKLSSDVSPEFVALLLGTLAYRGQIELSASGASDSMQNIGQSTVKELPITIPPLTEVNNILTYIATRLSTFDYLNNQLHQQNLLLQERRTALISAAVTGKIDLRGWQAPDGEAVA